MATADNTSSAIPGWIRLRDFVDQCGAEPACVAAALAVLKPAACFSERPLKVIWNFASSTKPTQWPQLRDVTDAKQMEDAFQQPVAVPLREVLRVLLVGPFDWQGAFDAATPTNGQLAGRRVNSSKYPRGQGGVTTSRKAMPAVVEPVGLVLDLEHVFIPQEEVSRCRRQLQLAPEQRRDAPVAGDVYDRLNAHPGLAHLLTEAINPDSERFAPNLARACALWLDVVRPVMFAKGELAVSLRVLVEYLASEPVRSAPYSETKSVIGNGLAPLLARVVEPEGRERGGTYKSEWCQGVDRFRALLASLNGTSTT